jgi:hypothetical protein
MKVNRDRFRVAGQGAPAPETSAPDSALDGQTRSADGSPPPRPASEQRDRILALVRDQSVHEEGPAWEWPRSSEQ